MPSIVSSSSKLKSNGYTNASGHQVWQLSKETHSWADRLICWIVPHRQVGVVERLLTRDALCGVEVKQLAQQVDREGICAREERLEGHTRLDRQ